MYHKNDLVIRTDKSPNEICKIERERERERDNFVEFPFTLQKLFMTYSLGVSAYALLLILLLLP